MIQFAFEKVTLDAAWTVNWKGRRDSERPDEQLNWSGQPRIEWVREVWKSGEYHFCLPVISVAPLYRRLASLVSQNKVPRVNVQIQAPSRLVAVINSFCSLAATCY